MLYGCAFHLLTNVWQSYDATTHFESTVADVLNMYTLITGKVIEFCCIAILKHVYFGDLKAFLVFFYLEVIEVSKIVGRIKKHLRVYWSCLWPATLVKRQVTSCYSKVILEIFEHNFLYKTIDITKQRYHYRMSILIASRHLESNIYSK